MSMSWCDSFPRGDVDVWRRGYQIQGQFGRSVGGECFIHGRASPGISPGMVVANEPSHRSLRSHRLQYLVHFGLRETQCTQGWLEQLSTSWCVLLPTRDVAVARRGYRIQGQLGRSVGRESFIYGRASPSISPGTVAANAPSLRSLRSHLQQYLVHFGPLETQCRQGWLEQLSASWCVLLPSRDVVVSRRGYRIQGQLGRSVGGQSFIYGRASPSISPGMVAANAPSHRSLRSH